MITPIAKGIFAILFLAVGLGTAGAIKYFERYSPTVPEIEAGIIYPFQVGGKTVFLSWTEDALLYVFPVSVFSFFLIITILHLRGSAR